jgi:hypothetical protein
VPINEEYQVTETTIKSIKVGTLMKHLLLTIIAFFLSAELLYAKSSDYEWANQISGSINDAGNGIVMDANDNVFIAGTFKGTLTIGTETLQSDDSYDSFIIKYDTNGDLSWAKNNDSNNLCTCSGISTDKFGNCIITGAFSDSITFDDWTLTSDGNIDIYIVKLDTDGNVIWAKKAGGTDNDSGRAIAVNNLGEIFISGYFEGTAHFDSVILYNSESRVFIAKYDVDGNIVWAKETNVLFSRGLGPNIAADNFGNCYITTHTNVSSATDIYVAKYNFNGGLAWSRIINGSGFYTYDYGKGIAVDSSGNVFVAGKFDGILNFASDTLDCRGSSSWEDIFLAKYSPNGNELWARPLCAAHYEFGQSLSIATDQKDNVIITGFFENTVNVENVTLTSNGLEDIFVCKYGNNGNLLWAISNGGISWDRGSGIATNKCGNIAAVGMFRDEITFGSKTLTCQSNYDIFVTKITKTYIGDLNRDCRVDMTDITVLAPAWLSKASEQQWNPECNISEPEDNTINFKDFATFAEHWMEGFE